MTFYTKHGLSPESEGYTNGTTTSTWFADIVYRGEVKVADFISPENKDRTEKSRNSYAPGPKGSVRTDTGKTRTVRGTSGKKADVRSGKDGPPKNPKTNTAAAGKQKTKTAAAAGKQKTKTAAAVGKAKPIAALSADRTGTKSAASAAKTKTKAALSADRTGTKTAASAAKTKTKAALSADRTGMKRPLSAGRTQKDAPIKSRRADAAAAGDILAERKSRQPLSGVKTAGRAAEKESIRIRKSRLLLPAPAVLLLGIWFLYALLNVLVPDRAVSETEKRALASFPEVSSDRIVSGAFSEDFETWASDQLVGRNALIRIRSTFGLLTGNRLSRDVFKSGDGYLIERMTEVDQNRLDQMLNAVNSFCARTEIPGTFVCAPNAVSICSDLLPASAITEDQGTWMQYIGSRLDGPEFCDLTGPLAEYYANGGQAYYRSDHHWTTEAAFYTLPTVRAALGLDPERAPSMTPLAVCNDFVGSLAAKSGFSVSKKDTIFIYRRDAEPAYIVTDPSAQTKRATVYSMDGLKSSDPYTVFLGGNTGHLNIRTDNADGGKLLVFKDSYFNCFLPFLLGDYREIDVIDPRYYYENLDELILMGGYDRVLFFYDLNTLAEDTSLALVLGTEQG